MREKYKTTGLNFSKLYLTTIEFYLRDARGFGQYVEEYIKQKIDRFDTDYPLDPAEEEKNPEYYHFMIDELSEKWWQFSRHFPGEFRASHVSQVYSGIDTHLARICERHYNSFLPEKIWKKMDSATEWGKKLKYLVKYAGVDKSTLQKDWDLLDKIRMVRNQIVHHHTKVSPAEKDWRDIISFVKKHSKMIEFRDDPDQIDRESGKPMYEAYPKHSFTLLVTSPELAKLLIDTAESFFKALLPQVWFKKSAE